MFRCSTCNSRLNPCTIILLNIVSKCEGRVMVRGGVMVLKGGTNTAHIERVCSIDRVCKCERVC